MELTKKAKFILFVILLTIFVLGVAIFGPKFVQKLQIEFGLKGKIELIEECIPMSGCAITTEELELYNHYKDLEKNKMFKELKETELGKIFLEREAYKENQE